MGSWEWEEAKIQQTEEGENRNLGMRQKLFVGNFPPFFRGEFRLEFTFFYRLNLLSLGNLWPKAEDFLVGKFPQFVVQITLVKPVVLAPVSNFGSWKLRGALGQYSNRSNCRLQCEGCFSNEPVSPTIAASFTRHTNRLL